MSSCPFSFNSGLDVLSVMTRNERILAGVRNLRLKNNGLPFISLDQLKKAERVILDKASKICYVKKLETGYMFRSENKVISDCLKTKELNKGLTVTQKIFLHSIACDYSVKPIIKKRKGKNPTQTLHTERPLKIDEDLSFAVAIVCFSNHTGQRKIGNVLGFARETILRKCKRNPYVNVKHKHVKFGTINGYSTTREAMRKQLRAMGLGHFKIKGLDIWKQLPNEYKLKKIELTFADHKTFHFQNKILNRQYRAGISNSGPLSTKAISMARARRNTARSSRALNLPGPVKSIKNSVERCKMFYDEREQNVKLIIGKTNRINKSCYQEFQRNDNRAVSDIGSAWGINTTRVRRTMNALPSKYIHQMERLERHITGVTVFDTTNKPLVIRRGTGRQITTQERMRYRNANAMKYATVLNADFISPEEFEGQECYKAKLQAEYERASEFKAMFAHFYYSGPEPLSVCKEGEY